MVFKTLLDMCRPFRPIIGLVLLFTLAMQLLSVVTPVAIGRLIDSIVNQESWHVMAQMLLIVAAMYIGIVIAGWLKDVFEIKYLDFSMPRHFAKMTMRKVMGFSIGQHLNEHSGFKMSVMSRGQGSINALIQMISYQIVPEILAALACLVALMIKSLLLGSILFVGVVGYAVFVFYDVWQIRRKIRSYEESQHVYSKHRSEIVKNVPLIIANAQELRIADQHDHERISLDDTGRNIQIYLSGRRTIRRIMLEVLRFTVLGIGVYLIYLGDHTPGSLLIFWSWSGNALGTIATLGGLQRRFAEEYSGVKTYIEMASIETDVPLAVNPISPEIFHGDIEFRHVSYAYRPRIEEDEMPVPSRPALTNVNFRLHPGERVVFVGESGAGKSTVASMLMRAQDPDEGQILIDGHDLRLLDLKRLRRTIGIVEQSVTLFDTTLRDNLLFGIGGKTALISDDIILKACKAARIDRFFDRLEHGLDTIVGENGVKLSGGERQRVGIARALLKDPAILILDEATSSLDAENEFHIQEALQQASEGRTTIVIAHRFSTIRWVDRVIVFTNGRIVGMGNHEELMATCDQYDRLVRHQLPVM